MGVLFRGQSLCVPWVTHSLLERKTLPQVRVPDLGMSTYMRRLGHPSRAFFSNTRAREKVDPSGSLPF
eukprot:366448-Chlamydomonas_euryale.AAC.5